MRVISFGACLMYAVSSALLPFHCLIHQMQVAQRTLSELQERIAGEDAAGALNWFRVDQILESTAVTANTRFYALQILEAAIKYRWKTLPPEQQASWFLYGLPLWLSWPMDPRDEARN